MGPAGRAVLFGGVCDEEEEETLEGDFYSDIYLYDTVKNRWFPGVLRVSCGVSLFPVRSRISLTVCELSGRSHPAFFSGG